VEIGVGDEGGFLLKNLFLQTSFPFGGEIGGDRGVIPVANILINKVSVANLQSC
jgi:hypothetical protein